MPRKSRTNAKATRRIFYGWYVAYALMVVSTMTAGFLFYNVSVLLEAFVAERGFPASPLPRPGRATSSPP